jgi:hypothetical protein
MFILSSKIIIGSFSFSGVNQLSIKRSMKSVFDTAKITIPHTVYIKRKGGKPAMAEPLMSVIADGDPVEIWLGYNNELKLEFKGFISTRQLSAELQATIECEGYSYKLRNNVDITKFYATTSASGLLSPLASLAGIQVKVTDDMSIKNIRLVHADGVEIVQELEKISMNTLAIFFVNPTTLWCGIVYSNYANNIDPLQSGTVKYKLGVNCIKDNSLKKRTTTEKVSIAYNGMGVNGDRIQTTSEEKNAKRKVQRTVNRVGDTNDVKKMAIEKEYRMNYQGYEGRLTGFLQPFCAPGWVASIQDPSYPDLDGKYLVEETEVTFGISGARRIVTIGPRLGFKSDVK